MFKLLHKKHVPPYVEVSAVLAGDYTVYLGTGETVGTAQWTAAYAAGGVPFVINNGLWPLALILAGNAAVVVSERGYV
jgi:hypothetical protein